MATEINYWEPFLEQYAASGLSQLKFCKVNQLPYHQFRYRLAKSKMIGAESYDRAFEPVMISKKQMESEWRGKVIDLTVHLPNKIRFDIKIEHGNAFSVLLKDLVALC